MNKKIYVEGLARRDKFRRLVWNLVYCLFYKWLPKPFFGRWRAFLLRSFGASIGKGCSIAPSCRIWAPWNMVIGDYVCLAEYVDFYCVDEITIESYATVSQRSFLCAASHRIDSIQRSLIHLPITVGLHAWICAEAFVGPGVSIGEGAVLAARGVAVRNLEEWSVYGGNPAKFIKKRILSES